VCKYRTKRIEISKYYAQHSPRESILDTLLHEIAHALAGPKAGHGPSWKAIAVRIGANPRACDNSEVAVGIAIWDVLTKRERIFRTARTARFVRSGKRSKEAIERSDHNGKATESVDAQLGEEG
jgi:hypothetical protein